MHDRRNMFVNHFKYPLKEGTLEVILDLKTAEEAPPGGADVSDSAYPNFTGASCTFEDAATGMFYDGTFSFCDLVAISRIFYWENAFQEIFTSEPTIQEMSGQPGRTAVFEYATARGNVYKIPLPLKPRKYPVEKQDVIELRAENSVLRKKVANLEEKIAKLEVASEQFRSNISIIAAHLLASDSGDERYTRCLASYPQMMLDSERKMRFECTNRNTILSSKDGRLFDAMVAAGMTNVFIGNIFTLGASGYHLDNYPQLVDRIKTIIDNIGQIDAIRMNGTGLSLLDYMKGMEERGATVPAYLEDSKMWKKLRKYAIEKHAKLDH